MDIDYAILADFAEVVGSKLYLMGGGWDTFSVPEAPCQVRLGIAVGVRFGWDETNVQTPVRIVVEDDDGTELVKIEGQLQVGRPAQLTPGSSQLAQLAANVAVNIPAIGGYRVHIEAGSGSARADRMLPFRMIRAT
jgi:hypothetical protein